MSTASSSGNDPRYGREVFRFVMWLSVAYACIIALEYLELMVAVFAMVALVCLAGTIDDMTGDDS